MSERTYMDFIKDIREMVEKIEAFTTGYTYEEFIEDEKTVFAVIRCFEVIGEAVKNVPEKIRGKFSSLPWKRMAGMRDKLIHEYFGVDYETLWNTVRTRIPEIKPLINKILKEMQDE
jgi:uncharacterized protein with HEPN domain